MDQETLFRAGQTLVRAGIMLGIAGVLTFIFLFFAVHLLTTGWAYLCFGIGLALTLCAVVCLRDASGHFRAVAKNQSTT